MSADTMAEALVALLSTENPPTNYGLTESDVAHIAAYSDWETRVDESNWYRSTDYDTIAEMIAAEPASFLADISRFYGDDYYLGPEEGVASEKISATDDRDRAHLHPNRFRRVPPDRMVLDHLGLLPEPAVRN